MGRQGCLSALSASANAAESKEELPGQVDRLPSAVLRNNLSLKEMVAIGMHFVYCVHVQATQYLSLLSK